MNKPKLLVISLDALSTGDIDYLQTNELFYKWSKLGTLTTNVNSIFISNTYPIHTSIITGVLPNKHSIIDNTYLEYGNSDPNWRWYYQLIKTPSIISQAVTAKLKVATIFWPVMAKAPVKYNIPEIIAKDHENQIFVVLKNSTKLFAISKFFKYGKDVKGSSQPKLDDFSIKVTIDILKKQQADVIFLHLTDSDTQKHNYGITSQQTKDSLDRMAIRVDQLLTLAYPDYQIIILSDHAQIDAQNTIDLNVNSTFNNTWWHQAAGSAFLLSHQTTTTQTIKDLKDWLPQQIWFKRYLTTAELKDSGFADQVILGIVPNNNYVFFNQLYPHIGNHGYPLDTPDYHPFYLVISPKIKKDTVSDHGSILDLYPIMAHLLDIPSLKVDGKLPDNILI